MARLVLKFGGTSVADVDRIRNVARHVKREVDAGHEVAVVVSAMSGVTNQLVKYVKDTSELYDPREYDAIVASGEQVTSGLLAIALQAMGVTARSWQGWQIPLETDASHGSAAIVKIDGEAMAARMKAGEVACIAGVQGVGPEQRIATLGRGGSDTSAVAIAAAVKADRCDIYTDVDGVYTTDPRVVPKARRMERISYEEMLEMASLGAKVLQVRSVEMAMFGPLADAAINVDMIVQNVSADGKTTDITFTVPAAEFARAKDILTAARGALEYRELRGSTDVVKVSCIGVGMRTHAGVAAKMFRALADKGINIQAITTSEIKVSILIDADYTELAVRTLHSLYGLDKA